MAMIHIYTGNGKGKSTAALGVAMRTAVHEKQVLMAYFHKGEMYSEKRLPQYFSTVEQLDCIIDGTESAERVKSVLELLTHLLESGMYALVVLDEIFIALQTGMLSLEQVKGLISTCHEDTELIMTGRNCPESLYEEADLVTEMHEIKHYYHKGIQGRLGIDF